MKIAKPNSCETNPLSEQRQALLVELVFTAEEFSLIQIGLIPQGMDEKWFIYFADDVLHFHRSWTGNEIYQLGLNSDNPNAIETTFCWVTRDPEQYKGTDDAEDVAILNWIIDRLLLNKTVSYPVTVGLSPEQIAVLRHNHIGNSRSNQQ